MRTKYCTLVVKYTLTDKWVIAFGDYSMETVKQERDDSYTGCAKTKIIRTDAAQQAIDEAVLKLNLCGG